MKTAVSPTYPDKNYDYHISHCYFLQTVALLWLKHLNQLWPSSLFQPFPPRSASVQTPQAELPLLCTQPLPFPQYTSVSFFPIKCFHQKLIHNPADHDAYKWHPVPFPQARFLANIDLPPNRQVWNGPVYLHCILLLLRTFPFFLFSSVMALSKYSCHSSGYFPSS